MDKKWIRITTGVLDIINAVIYGGGILAALPYVLIFKPGDGGPDGFFRLSFSLPRWLLFQQGYLFLWAESGY